MSEPSLGISSLPDYRRVGLQAMIQNRAFIGDGIEEVPNHYTIPEFELESGFTDPLYAIEMNECDHSYDDESDHFFNKQYADQPIELDLHTDCNTRPTHHSVSDDIDSINNNDDYRIRVPILDSHIKPTPRSNLVWDHQGLAWDGWDQRQRVVEYRRTTFASYTHYPGSISQGDSTARTLDNGSHDILADCRFYNGVEPQLVHFQLRNVLASFNRDEVLVAGDNLSLLSTKTGKTASINTFLHTQISTVASLPSSYATAGTFDGGLLVYFHSGEGQTFQLTSNNSGDCTINYIQPCNDHPEKVTVAANNRRVITFDVVKGVEVSSRTLRSAANCLAQNPACPSQVLLVGDSRQSLVVDRRTPDVKHFIDHHDYSFACDWTSDHIMATGSQDSTVKVYDDRRLGKPMATFDGIYRGAIRNLRFSKDGRYLAFAESIDNAYIVDLQKANHYQRVSFLGKVAGLDFSPGSGELTIGVCDRTVGGVLRWSVDERDWMRNMEWI